MRLINWLVASGVALAMITSVTAETAKERNGTVVRVKGKARYSTGNNVWQPIKVGTVLKAGATVQTGQDSMVDILLGDSALKSGTALADTANTSKSGSGAYQPAAKQDIIHLWADTTLVLDKLAVTKTGADQVTETQLDLKAGRIFGTVKKLSATSRYEIKIPNGVAGIRGTIYSISTEGVVAVLVGSVVISWTDVTGVPHLQEVSAGNQFDVRTGSLAPLPPGSEVEVMNAEAAAAAGVTTPPQTFQEDQTIYNVSPK